MTIKNLAYRVQQRLSSAIDGSFKRSHVYELFAAAFGHGSYAAFCCDSVFTQVRPSAPLPAANSEALKQRCHDLGYASSADAITTGLIDELQTARLAAVRIEDVVDAIQTVQGDSWGWEEDDESDAGDSVDPSAHDLINFEADEPPTFLLESLESAANRSNPSAHYALALLNRDRDGQDDFLKPQSSSYWHEQRLKGEDLSPAASEWADAYARQMDRAQRVDFHLREAARLGDRLALLELADIHGDPTFFDVSPDGPIVADPSRVAEIAARLGRDADAHHWLTIAARAGDIEAIQTLVESYDQADLARCWTWIYLAQLLGTDLTKDDLRAYHDGGPQADQEYDDDHGGGAYVAGREAIELEPLAAEADRVARQRAEALYQEIENDGDDQVGSAEPDHG